MLLHRQLLYIGLLSLLRRGKECHVVTILNGFLSRILYIFFINLPLSWAICPTCLCSTPPVLENSYPDMLASSHWCKQSFQHSLILVCHATVFITVGLQHFVRSNPLLGPHLTSWQLCKPVQLGCSRFPEGSIISHFSRIFICQAFFLG